MSRAPLWHSRPLLAWMHNLPGLTLFPKSLVFACNGADVRSRTNACSCSARLGARPWDSICPCSFARRRAGCEREQPVLLLHRILSGSTILVLQVQLSCPVLASRQVSAVSSHASLQSCSAVCSTHCLMLWGDTCGTCSCWSCSTCFCCTYTDREGACSNCQQDHVTLQLVYARADTGVDPVPYLQARVQHPWNQCRVCCSIAQQVPQQRPHTNALILVKHLRCDQGSLHVTLCALASTESCLHCLTATAMKAWLFLDHLHAMMEL